MHGAHGELVVQIEYPDGQPLLAQPEHQTPRGLLHVQAIAFAALTPVNCPTVTPASAAVVPRKTCFNPSRRLIFRTAESATFVTRSSISLGTRLNRIGAPFAK
jgi:hypothetical protein